MGPVLQRTYDCLRLLLGSLIKGRAPGLEWAAYSPGFSMERHDKLETVCGRWRFVIGRGNVVGPHLFVRPCQHGPSGLGEVAFFSKR